MKACCQDEANLKEEEVGEHLVCRTCQICGARHYEFDLDEALLGLDVKGI